MGKGADPSLSRGIAFRICLGLEGPGGSDVDNACSRVKVGKQKQAQEVGGCDSRLQNVVEVGVAAGGEDASLGQAGVVDQVIHLSVCRDHFLYKIPQGLLFREIPMETQGFAP